MVYTTNPGYEIMRNTTADVAMTKKALIARFKAIHLSSSQKIIPKGKPDVSVV